MPSNSILLRTIAWGATFLPALGCAQNEEASRVSVDVVSEAVEVLSAETDDGATVEITKAIFLITDLRFTGAGEAHASSLLDMLYGWVVPEARAHPGHTTGGTVTGELGGRFLVNPFTHQTWGPAELLVSNYESCNFKWGRATENDLRRENNGPAEAAPALDGYSVFLSGTIATRLGTKAFVARVNVEGKEVQGVPFSTRINQASHGPIRFHFLPVDPIEGDTLFDGIAFDSLPLGDDGTVEISNDAPSESTRKAHDLLESRFLTPDHFLFEMSR